MAQTSTPRSARMRDHRSIDVLDNGKPDDGMWVLRVHCDVDPGG